MINETTEGQEAGEQREELFFKVIEAGNKILEILAALFIILMLLYGAYSLWDTCQINRRAFISGELMKYKPAGKTDESPSLQELQKINPDVCAWLTVDGTKIDYPVVQGETNLEYINQDIYGEFALSGSIFLDKDNSPDFTNRKTILYGHNMKDGSMFRGLRNFLDDEFLKEHHILYLYLPDEGVWIFVIVKCEYTPADGDAFLLGTQEEVPTLLLSTCGTDASKRLVVWCERQEEKGEQIEYSDEETEVQEAGDDLAFLDGEFVENETHDFI